MSTARPRLAPLASLLFITVLVLLPVSSIASPSLTLGWNPSPGTNVAGYHLYYGGASGNYTNTIDAGTNTMATVPGLTIGATYYFAATAYDGDGLESEFSNEINYTIPTPNMSPTLDAITSVTVNENAGLQVVSLSGITSGSSNQTQTLTVTASSDDTTIVPTPVVTYSSPNTTGSLSFTPATYNYGTATITVTVNNGGSTNNTISRSFTVTVNPVNQPPTLNALANMTLNENAGLQTVNLSGITSGAPNEFQTLTVTASSSNPSLIPTPTVNYTSPNTTGSMTFAPATYGSGTATITVTVNDGGASNNIVSRSFSVTVNPVNQAPTLDPLASVTLNENASAQTVNLTGITSGAPNESQTLAVTATSSNPGLIPNPIVSYTSPNATGSITLAPLQYANGSATITVTVNDGGSSNNVVSRSFVVTVNPVNQIPTLNALADMIITENAGKQTVNLSGINSGAPNEVQTLTITASSSNTGLIPNPTVSYSSPSATGSISFTPVANAYGTATITVTVNDGGASNNIVSKYLAVTVDATPTISGISDRLIATNTSTPAIGFTIGDPNGSVNSLTLSASSSDLSLVPNANIILGGSGTSRTVIVTPAANQTGSTTITITVSDGYATASTDFNVTVRTRPAPPGDLHVAQVLP